MRLGEFRARGAGVAGIAGVAAVLVAVVSCKERTFTQPSDSLVREVAVARTGSGADVALESCSPVCELWNSAIPLRLAAAPADSAGLPIPVAWVTVAPGEASTLTLHLTLADGVDAGLEPESLIVAGPTWNRRVALRRAPEVMTVPLPADSTEMPLVVSLARRLPAPRPDVTRLALEASLARPVRRSFAPFLDAVDASTAIRAGLVAAVSPSCLVLHPSPPPCLGVGITLDPNEDDGPFGGFQWAPGTGIMQPVSVTFSRPVGSVLVVVLDPTYSGNTVTAFDSAGGVISTQAVPFSGVPGVFTIQAVEFTGRIKRLLLVPAPVEYVAYRLLVTPDAAPSADVISLVPIGGDSLPPSGTRVTAFGESRRQIEVQVRTAAGAPVVGRTVNIAVVIDSISGGHTHDHPNPPTARGARPKGHFAGAGPVVSLVTGADGNVRATYVASIVGGTERIRANAQGADSTDLRLVLAVPGIVPVRRSGSNYLIVPTSNHFPADSFAQAGVIEATMDLFARYLELNRQFATQYPFIGDQGRFLLTALGLPRGGLYDYKATWAPPHASHREGLDVDFNDVTDGGAESGPTAERRMKRLCEQVRYNGRALSCVLELPRQRWQHFHIDFERSFQ